MPTGGGDLSAMVRWDGSLHLHLTKSDGWGFRAPPDALLGTRCFNNVSPGHVRIDFGGRGRRRQRGRFASGWTSITAGSSSSWASERDGPRLEVWGHPQRKILVVEVIDPAASAGRGNGRAYPSGVRRCRSAARPACCTPAKCYDRPARPHLANTGMQDFFARDRDPLLGRGTAVVVGCPAIAPKSCSAAGSTAPFSLPAKRPAPLLPDRRRGGHAFRRSAGCGPARTRRGRPRGTGNAEGRAPGVVARLLEPVASCGSTQSRREGRSALCRVPRAPVHVGLRQPRAVPGQVGRRAGPDARRRAELGPVGMGPGDPLHLPAALRRQPAGDGPRTHAPLLRDGALPAESRPETMWGLARAVDSRNGAALGPRRGLRPEGRRPRSRGQSLPAPRLDADSVRPL